MLRGKKEEKKLAFIFSSPWKIGEVKLAPLQHLDSYSHLKQSLITAQLDLHVTKTHGTPTSLKTTLSDQRPNAIHFVGHAITAASIKAQNS